MGFEGGHPLWKLHDGGRPVVSVLCRVSVLLGVLDVHLLALRCLLPPFLFFPFFAVTLAYLSPFLSCCVFSLASLFPLTSALTALLSSCVWV